MLEQGPVSFDKSEVFGPTVNSTINSGAEAIPKAVLAVPTCDLTSQVRLWTR